MKEDDFQEIFDNVEDYVDFVVSQGGSQRVKKIPDLTLYIFLLSLSTRTAWKCK